MKSLTFKMSLLLGLFLVVVAPFTAKAADSDERVASWKVETQERILDAKDQAQQEVEQTQAEHEQAFRIEGSQNSEVLMIITSS